MFPPFCFLCLRTLRVKDHEKCAFHVYFQSCKHNLYHCHAGPELKQTTLFLAILIPYFPLTSHPPTVAQFIFGRLRSSGASPWQTLPTSTGPPNLSPCPSNLVSVYWRARRFPPHSILARFLSFRDIKAQISKSHHGLYILRANHLCYAFSPFPFTLTLTPSGDGHGHHLVSVQLRHHAGQLQPLQRQRLHGRHGQLPALAKVHRPRSFHLACCYLVLSFEPCRNGRGS